MLVEKGEKKKRKIKKINFERLKNQGEKSHEFYVLYSPSAGVLLFSLILVLAGSSC